MDGGNHALLWFRKWLRIGGRGRPPIGVNLAGSLIGMAGSQDGGSGRQIKPALDGVTVPIPAPNGVTATAQPRPTTETETLIHQNGMENQFLCKRTFGRSRFGKPRQGWIPRVVDLVCWAD